MSDHKGGELNKNIYVDQTEALNYERLSSLRKLLNIFIFPFLSVISKSVALLLISKSKRAYAVKKHATTHKALEAMYTYRYDNAKKQLGFFELIWTHLLLNFVNCKAVRNRLKLVKKTLRDSIESVSKSVLGDQITIVSIASGSARAVLETIDEMDIRDRIRPILIDRSKEALDYSRGLAEQFEIGNLQLITGKIEKISSDLVNMKPHIVEMVGLLDYLNDDRAITLFRDIYSALPKGGIFITCNVANNPEKKFANTIIGWPLIYRNGEELFSLIEASGFMRENIEVVYEPLRIHGVAIATK